MYLLYNVKSTYIFGQFALEFNHLLPPENSPIVHQPEILLLLWREGHLQRVTMCTFHVYILCVHSICTFYTHIYVYILFVNPMCTFYVYIFTFYVYILFVHSICTFMCTFVNIMCIFYVYIFLAPYFIRHF